MSLLPSQPKPVPLIHLGREEQVRVKSLVQGHNTRPTLGSNSQPWDHESGALPLSNALTEQIKNINKQINQLTVDGKLLFLLLKYVSMSDTMMVIATSLQNYQEESQCFPPETFPAKNKFSYL